MKSPLQSHFYHSPIVNFLEMYCSHMASTKYSITCYILRNEQSMNAARLSGNSRLFFINVNCKLCFGPVSIFTKLEAEF